MLKSTGFPPPPGGVLSVNQNATRPRGVLFSGGRNEFPYAAVIATITGGPGNTTDFLAWAQPSESDSAWHNAIYLNGSPTTPPGTGRVGAVVTVPSVPSLFFSDGSGAWNPSIHWPVKYGGSAVTVNSWQLRFYNGKTHAVVARVPITIDVLDRKNLYFPAISKYIIGSGIINLNPFVSTGSSGGFGAVVISGSSVGLLCFVGTTGGGAPSIVNSLTLQYQVDGVDIGSPTSGPPSPGHFQGWPATLDTTGLTDGTHALGVRVIDYTGGDHPPYQYKCQPTSIIVHNGGLTLAQLYDGAHGTIRIPIFDQSSGPNNRMNSAAIDWLTFPGTNALPLSNTSVNIPTPQSGFIPPATADSRYNTPTTALLLRDSSKYYNENLSGAITTEYTGYQRWFDNTLGGVFANQDYPEGVQGLEGNYAIEITKCNFDGNRGDTLVSNICNAVEGYESDGNAAFWLVAESTGRITRQNYNGSTVTLAGLRLDRSKLPFPAYPTGNGISLSQWNTRMEHVGTIDALGSTATPSFGDLRGCHEIKYLPTGAGAVDPNTVFVANVLHHCVVKITGLLSGSPHLVRYAGQYDSLGGTSTNYVAPGGDFQDGVATEFISGSPVATFSGSIDGTTGNLTVGGGTYTGNTNLKGCPLSWSGHPNTDYGTLVTGNISGAGASSSWTTNYRGTNQTGISITASTRVALFNRPYSLEVADGTGADPIGTLYIADFQNFRLRKIDTSGNVTTLFGSQDNVLLTARGGVGWTQGLPSDLAKGALTNPDSSPRAFPITSLSWSGGLLAVTTSLAVQADATQLFAGTYPIQPSWTVLIQGTGNSNLDNNYWQVAPSPSPSTTSFSLVVPSNPGALSSSGNIYALFQDVYVPTVPTYRPWNHGSANEAYFPWMQRLSWSSPNPNAGTSIVGGSTKRHLVAGGTWHFGVLDVDLENQQVRTIGCLAGGPHNRMPSAAIRQQNPVAETSSSFFGIDCDETGANGPLNDIMIALPSASLENFFWRLSWTGDEGALPWGVQNNGQNCPLRFGVNVGGGHYPWLFVFGRKQGRMLSSGTSDLGLFQWRIFNPAHDVYGDTGEQGDNITANTNYDCLAATRAMAIYTQGAQCDWPFTNTPGMFPWGTRPTGWALHGSTQNNYLGLQTYSGGTAVGDNTDTFDGLAANIAKVTVGSDPDANLTAFIQSGFGGSVPRPELTGDDLKDLKYFIRRSSMAGCLVADVNSFPQREPYETDVTAPIISSPVATRASPTSITVTWSTDKPTFGFAAAGFASGQGTTYPYHMWQLESWGGSVAASYRTSHNVTIAGLKASVTTYLVIMAKDVAGNNAWSVQMTVS